MLHIFPQTTVCKLRLAVPQTFIEPLPLTRCTHYLLFLIRSVKISNNFVNGNKIYICRGFNTSTQDTFYILYAYNCLYIMFRFSYLKLLIDLTYNKHKLVVIIALLLYLDLLISHARKVTVFKILNCS